MNCLNQQFPGMPDCGGQDSMPGWQGRPEEKRVPAWKTKMPQNNTPDWQNQPWGANMPGWSGQVDSANAFFWQPAQPGSAMPVQNNSGMDCGMPPSTIPQQPQLQPQLQPQPKNRPMKKEKTNNSNFACKMEEGKFPIAMGYVPIQQWTQPRPMCDGFRRGSIFKELDLPFMMGRCQ